MRSPFTEGRGHLGLIGFSLNGRKGSKEGRHPVASLRLPQTFTSWLPASKQTPRSPGIDAQGTLQGAPGL